MDAAITSTERVHSVEARRAWPLVLAFAVLAAPTLLGLANQTWSREAGAHGPIVLATGGWLLWRQLPLLAQAGRPGNPWITTLLLAIALPAYVGGQMFDFLALEAGGVYLVGIAMLQAEYGLGPLRNLAWFPLLYLAFVVPPPSGIAEHVTAPLKTFVSYASTNILHAAGLPVMREGVTIYVGSYQLLVEDACSGMNSLFGLTAISLFYIYLRRGASVSYSLLMLILAAPIAVAANVVRIMILILLTYFCGDEVAQGFLHFTAGILLFATCLLLVFAIDGVVYPIFARVKSK